VNYYCRIPKLGFHLTVFDASTAEAAATRTGLQAVAVGRIASGDKVQVVVDTTSGPTVFDVEVVVRATRPGGLFKRVAHRSRGHEKIHFFRSDSDRHDFVGRKSICGSVAERFTVDWTADNAADVPFCRSCERLAELKPGSGR
jgi:hypothetical protein